MKIKLYIIMFAMPLLGFAQTDDILLKDYKPKSIYKVPVTKIEKAKYPVIDMHSHPYAQSPDEIEQWIKNMDKFGIEKTLILTYQTGSAFDSIYDIYSQYNDRFEIWCGFDYTGYENEGWTEKAIKELERCYKKGARGVGELGDKGLGLLYSQPTPGKGLHIDDPRMADLLKRCGELGMPISIHVAEPIWMYQKIDVHNDGLMNAAEWAVDMTQPGILDHDELITTLENAVRENPGTTFIACHYANCSYDLNKIGELLDEYPNLYADIAARYAETAPIPRATKDFFMKHQNKLVYGTDMGFEPSMYSTTFRILETNDEHFYANDLFGYHWALYGIGLSDNVLKKVYNENARKILHQD